MYNAKKRRIRAYQWRDELRKRIYAKTLALPDWRIGVTDDPRVTSPGFNDAGWRAARPGARLGGINEFVWLRGKFAVPREFAGGRVTLRIDVAAPGALFGQRGLVFVNGVETVGIDRHHDEAPLLSRAKGGERFAVAVEVYTGPMPGFKILDFGDEKEFVSRTAFGSVTLNLVNDDAYRLYHDVDTAVEILDALAQGSRAEATVLAAIDACIEAIDLQAADKERNAGLRRASAVLKQRLFSGQKGDAAGKVLLIGQSHIDMAWLWPRAETIRKCASTMANTLSFQEAYPFYRFSHSQAQGFQWLKDLYPALYERTRRAARAGRIEAMGGTWVEADLNCAGGEALARQFLYGQRFFRREFGSRCRVGWLIDTFGYSWAMPQILKESGLDYFVSTKPTWNDTNVFPFTFFWWEGPDGSRVLTHIPPRSYGGDVTLSAILDTIEKDKEARLGVAPALLYGKSDGGGGPRVDDLERIPRLMASPYAPKIEICNVTEYFDQVSTTAKYPVFTDEMYVETHRGTYTTQARTKHNNRKAECGLYAAEAVASAAAMLGARYPHKELEAAWKLALFNQFHDILPGSSIPLVYEDAEKDYAELFRTTGEVTARSLEFVARNVRSQGAGRAVLVFNPSAWERTDVVEIDADAKAEYAADADGTPLPCQAADGKSGRMAILVTVPRFGWRAVRIVKGKRSPLPAAGAVKGRLVETPLLSVRFNASGQLASVYDRVEKREVLARAQAGNRLELMEDIPVEYEAWDIDEWTGDKKREVRNLVSFDVAENGPVRTVVRLVWKAGKSTFTQRVMLYQHTRRIDFVTEADWREKKTLLKAAFPLAVRSRRATYEIAFGAIDRSVHQSNPWDWARFEVPAHKWADLSQADYGASVLNDSKYGYDARGDTLRITLLRSPESPGVDTDQGRQEFTYSLYPHAGDWREGNTVPEAFDLNVPLLATEARASKGVLPPEGSFVSLETGDGRPVVLSAVKAAEDGKGFVVRFYEPLGRRTTVTITTAVPIASARSVNFLEEPKARLRHGKNSVRVVLEPWKIMSLHLVPK